MTAHDALEDIVKGLDERWQISRREDGELTITAMLVCDHGACSVVFWARAHVGGLYDFEVIDGESREVFWRHLEAPTPDAVRTAWTEMVAALDSLKR